MKKFLIYAAAVMVFTTSCQQKNSPDMQKKVDQFVTVDLKTDISHLSEKEKQMLPLLFDAAQIMD